LTTARPSSDTYGESLANALAVYLLSRYAARCYTPKAYKGGYPDIVLSAYWECVGDNLTEDLSLSELAALAGMSSHYFARLIRQSTGCTPLDGVKQHGRLNDNHLGRLIGHDCRRLVVHVRAP
jgi:AraC family transcriptional regulator